MSKGSYRITTTVAAVTSFVPLHSSQNANNCHYLQPSTARDRTCYVHFPIERLAIWPCKHFDSRFFDDYPYSPRVNVKQDKAGQRHASFRYRSILAPLRLILCRYSSRAAGVLMLKFAGSRINYVHLQAMNRSNGQSTEGYCKSHL